MGEERGRDEQTAAASPLPPSWTHLPTPQVGWQCRVCFSTPCWLERHWPAHSLSLSPGVRRLRRIETLGVSRAALAQGLPSGRHGALSGARQRYGQLLYFVKIYGSGLSWLEKYQLGYFILLGPVTVIYELNKSRIKLNEREVKNGMGGESNFVKRLILGWAIFSLWFVFFSIFLSFRALDGVGQEKYSSAPRALCREGH